MRADRLVGRARTDSSGLTSAEAQALFLLVGPAAAGRVRLSASTALMIAQVVAELVARYGG